LLVLEDIVYSPEGFCLENGILSVLITHIYSIVYRNHEVLPKPQMSEEFNHKCNNNPLLRRIAELCKNAGCWLIEDNTYDYFMMG
jgi:hypothetical protein